MKIVFMGTPQFAVPSLKKLYEENYEIQAVVTQPDKKKGRGMQKNFSPIKQYALNIGANILQPEKIKGNLDFIKELKALNTDFIVVVAYGKILPEEVLSIPKYGCINVHASLLPKYRGAAPINWAIINGEKETGITTMFMDKGLDTGDMLLKKSIKIMENDDAITIHDKLADLGGNVLIDTIEGLKKGLILPIKQNEDEATYAPIISKKMGHIDWSKDCNYIRNLVRGMVPWPGTYTFYNGKMLKIWKTEFVSYDGYEEEGTVLSNNNKLLVKCLNGALNILEVQGEGTKRMNISDYLRGHNIIEGTVLN
ncbi:MAG: methionyl-tRNA formyltransferase [Thermoanaerobacteraceae bacterium]